MKTNFSAEISVGRSFPESLWVSVLSEEEDGKGALQEDQVLESWKSVNDCKIIFLHWLFFFFYFKKGFRRVFTSVSHCVKARLNWKCQDVVV